MQANISQAVSYILEDEGPEINDSPSEPGHISVYGLSLTYMKEIFPSTTFDDVKAMTAARASEIYGTIVAPTIRFNDLPSGVDYRLLDIRVNLGLTGGIMALELALGRFPVLGVLTDDLIGATHGMVPQALVAALSAVWITKKHESPNWKPSIVTMNGYGHGWSNRNIRATARALAMIGA